MAFGALRFARQPLAERGAAPQTANAQQLPEQRKRNPFGRATSLDSGMPSRPFRLPAFASTTDRAATMATTSLLGSEESSFDEIEPEPDDAEPEVGESASSSLSSQPAALSSLTSDDIAEPYEADENDPPSLSECAAAAPVSEPTAPILIRRLLSNIGATPAPELKTAMTTEAPGGDDTTREEQTVVRKRSQLDDEAALAVEVSLPPPIRPAAARKVSGPALFSTFVVDWSISSEITFTSPTPFAFFKPATSIEASRGLLQFSAHSHPSLSNQMGAINIHQALFYWVCGGLSITSDDQTGNLALQKRRRTDATPEDQRLLDYQLKRIDEWKQALTSLYFMLRHGFAAYFYVRYKTFSVAFVASKSTSGGCQAVVTRSTRGLRSTLTEKGIPFVLPLGTGVRSKLGGAKHDSTDVPALMDTTAGVHGLFNLLYSMPIDRHLPELLAPAPFLGATLRSTVIVNNRPIKNVRPGTTELEELHELVLRGPILPSTLRSLQQAFACEGIDPTFARKMEPSDVVPTGVVGDL